MGGQTSSSSQLQGMLITLFSNSNGFTDSTAQKLAESFVETFIQVLARNFPSVSETLQNQKPHNVRWNSRAIQHGYNLKEPLPKASELFELRHTPTLKDFESTHHVNIILDAFRTPLNPSSLHRPLRLALFDMDSTLINEEVIDELARSIGKTDAVSAITHRAMNGEIDFETSLRERVAMLKGVKTTIWDALQGTLTITNGARELIQALKEAGVMTVVVSGGFTPMAEWLKGELGLDQAIANHVRTLSERSLQSTSFSNNCPFHHPLTFHPPARMHYPSIKTSVLMIPSQLLTSPPTPTHPYPHLTGTLSPDHPVVTPELKRSRLLSLAESHNLLLSETLAVGDGSNDLLMLHAAGLGIAYNAKQRVQEAAPMRLNGQSLVDILCLLGLEGPEPMLNEDQVDGLEDIGGEQHEGENKG